jgi:hypothetical protein
MEFGICPVAEYKGLEGAHNGENAGRACWVVAGSLCGGRVQGTYAQKLMNCRRCDFMNLVKKEEEPSSFGFSHTRRDNPGTGKDQAMIQRSAEVEPPPAGAGGSLK